ncbi:MAG: hypothetical protein LBH20_00815, partial [Treponema sp.]|nr:hypothetical protein [Treponema sp.]
KKNMRKTSGDEGCHGKNAVLRHGVFAMTGPRMLISAYTSFHAFVVLVNSTPTTAFPINWFHAAGNKRRSL